MCGLLCSPPFVWFICARMWGPRVLPAALPAPFSATLSPALSVYLCANVGPAGSASGQTACPFHPTLHQSHSRHGHVSPLCPSYRSGCMFLFYLLGVGLPCCLIFCQFWLCEEAQCVYLRRHLGSPSLFTFLNSFFFNLIWMDVYFFLLFQIVALSPGFLPISVGSLTIRNRSKRGKCGLALTCKSQWGARLVGRTHTHGQVLPCEIRPALYLDCYETCSC